jgi:2-dehydropantoate 2-reductase
MSPDRRYVVLGAGAVGCALGGMLQAAGSPVVLVARGAHLDALQRRGLDIALPSHALHLAVEAVKSPADIRFAARDVVILCTKSQDSAAALADLAAAAPRDVPVVCAQNGVANEPLAAERFARVYALVVFAPCQFVEPGRISIHSEPVLGGLDIGCHPSGTDDVVGDLARDLSAAGFDARSEPRIGRLRYAKLLSNLGNALQALAGRAATESPLSDQLRAEGEACLRAAGIDFASLDELYARNSAVHEMPVSGAPRGGGSTWQSLARRTGSLETDYLNGAITALGERYGVPSPANRAVLELARRAAAERWPPEHLTVAEIEDAVAARRT